MKIDKKKKIAILAVWAILWGSSMIYMNSTLFSLVEQYDVPENTSIILLLLFGFVVMVVFGIVGGIVLVDFLDYLDKRQEKRKK